MARYNNRADFVLHALMIVALVFVLLQALNDVLQALEGIDPALKPRINWFEMNYISKLHSVKFASLHVYSSNFLPVWEKGRLTWLLDNYQLPLHKTAATKWHSS